MKKTNIKKLVSARYFFLSLQTAKLFSDSEIIQKSSY